MYFVRSILCALALLALTLEMSNATTFDERLSGDIDAFPRWQLDLGINTFVGTLSAGSTVDLDNFSFLVPYGTTANLSLKVDSLFFNDATSGFQWSLFKQPGGCIIFLGRPSCIWSGQLQQIASETYSIDKNEVIALGSPFFGSLGNLSNGPYALNSSSIQLMLGDGSLSHGTMDYTFQIQVSAIPEPNAFELLALGIPLMAFSLRTCSMADRKFSFSEKAKY